MSFVLQGEEDIAPLSSIIKISSRFKPSAMTHICVWTLYLLHPTLSIKPQLEGLVQHFQGQGRQQDGCQQDGQYQLVHDDDDDDSRYQLVHEDDDVDDSRYQLVLEDYDVLVRTVSIGS